ncbi:hypothetical protein A0H81_09371 [Grifola frondosa]|uniref:Uncharacterized protein n=1 Tax=Grifola frondosa TaxID=5627 RepID=A0A1C7M2L9_GRIFR|nr:hypothetical protein A0H81_09371 [Grifola frondosa]
MDLGQYPVTHSQVIAAAKTVDSLLSSLDVSLRRLTMPSPVYASPVSVTLNSSPASSISSLPAIPETARRTRHVCHGQQCPRCLMESAVRQSARSPSRHSTQSASTPRSYGTSRSGTFDSISTGMTSIVAHPYGPSRQGTLDSQKRHSSIPRASTPLRTSVASRPSRAGTFDTPWHPTYAQSMNMIIDYDLDTSEYT